MRLSIPPKVTLLGTVILLVVLAGCVSGETDPRPGFGDLSLRVNETAPDQTPFTAEVAVSFEWAVEDSVQFENVMLCLYRQDGSVLNTTNLGTFSTPQTRVRIPTTAPERPEYIVVDHPGLRENGFVEMRFWNEEQSYYDIGTIDDIEFDYARSDEAGSCA